MDVTILDWNDGDFAIADASEALSRDGAFLMRGVLGADEVALARSQLTARLRNKGQPINLGWTQPNAAIAAPEIDWLVADPRIVATFKKLLGDAVFTGHCDIHMNLLSGWHKDSGEHIGGYFRGDYFSADDCRVYKAAIYLQDASANDGLTVRLGSHRRSSHEGRTCKLPIKAGDVVFFDVRLSHTGQLPDFFENVIKALVRPTLGADRHDPAWAMKLRSGYCKLIGRRDRLSVFFTYGSPNSFTNDFARANMVRQHVQLGEKADDLPLALVSRLDSQGVGLAEFA